MKPGHRPDEHALAPEAGAEPSAGGHHDGGGDDVGGDDPGDLVLRRRERALHVRQAPPRRWSSPSSRGTSPASPSAVMSAGCRGRPGTAPRSLLAARERGSRLQEARQLALVDQPLHHARQTALRPVSTVTVTVMPARSCGCPARLLDLDAHRNALHHLHPVAGRVLRRQHGELGAGRRRDRRDHCAGHSMSG